MTIIEHVCEDDVFDGIKGEVILNEFIVLWLIWF